MQTVKEHSSEMTLIPYTNTPHNTHLLAALKRVRNFKRCSTLEPHPIPAPRILSKPKTIEKVVDVTDSKIQSPLARNPGNRKLSSLPMGQNPLPKTRTNYGRNKTDSFGTQSVISYKSLNNMTRLPTAKVPVFTSKQKSSWTLNEQQRASLQERLSRKLTLAEFASVATNEQTPGHAITGTGSSTNEKIRLKEGNHVRLRPRKDNPAGYINASHVQAWLNKELWHYIATISPRPGNNVDFWQMVWEQGICIIVSVEENGRYEEELQGQNPDQGIYGEFVVNCGHPGTKGTYDIPSLERLLLVHLPSKQRRPLWKLCYKGAAEHEEQKDTRAFLGFIRDVQSIRSKIKGTLGHPAPCPPVLVHCKDGVSLTGILILSEMAISCWERNIDAEVADILARIREQRREMVQTHEQYLFVLKLLILILSNSRLI
uniref:tyrosine-protein phosphatase non-receptor type 14-like n=1 Tax=Myxine glutinosa TaxID=7769 RepID=UPI00358E7B4B